MHLLSRLRIPFVSPSRAAVTREALSHAALSRVAAIAEDTAPGSSYTDRSTADEESSVIEDRPIPPTVVGGRRPFLPGRYEVTFDRRFGSHRSVPPPVVLDAADGNELGLSLADHFRTHSAPAARVQSLYVLVDPEVRGGQIYSGDSVVAVFAFTPITEAGAAG